MSGPLQNVPSSHGAVLAVCAQVPVPEQWSSVQSLTSSVHGVLLSEKHVSASSSHVSAHSPPARHGSPACVQVPLAQTSVPLQNVASSHGAVLFVWPHVPLPSQRSSVQTFESLAQGVDELANASAGHVAAPLQTSATSQTLPAARQVVALDAKPSAGHEADAPLQVSATSQITADPRQVFPDVNESAGQLADAPVQFSATSQTPATERQTVAPLAKQLSGPSLHVLPQIPPPMHGSPAWLLHVPPAQVSGPLQNRPSLHGAVLLLCTQVPAPLHSSSVQTLPSVVHADPRSSLQVSAASL